MHLLLCELWLYAAELGGLTPASARPEFQRVQVSTYSPFTAHGAHAELI
jgi:hypothetical protein